MSNGLRILRATIRPPTPVTEEEATHHISERQHVDVDVENSGTAPLHVWTGARAYAYDPATGLLDLYLAEADVAVPPGIEIISDHPRVPPQVVVAAGATATIDVPILTVIRRRVAGQGLGLSYVEEAVDNIQQVHLHIQYADVPFQAIVGEEPERQRERLRAHGQIADEVIVPTSSKE